MPSSGSSRQSQVDYAFIDKKEEKEPNFILKNQQQLARFMNQGRHLPSLVI